jgi:hypothetical protein
VNSRGDAVAVLRGTCAEVARGWWVGGDDAPVPAEVGTVVTLDDASPPVPDRSGSASAVVEVRHPFFDGRWEPVVSGQVDAAVAAVLAADGPVLVRCRYGLNRSALVVGLALVRRGWPAADVVHRLRSVRPGALTNPYFVDLLATSPDEPGRGG